MAGPVGRAEPGGDLVVFHPGSAPLQVSENEIFEGGQVESCELSAMTAALAGHPAGTARTALVRFKPGARTRFHTHAADQILIITEGRGHVGRPGRDITVEVGDVVVVPAGLRHYHGAGELTPMAHITILMGAGTELAEPHRQWPPQGE